MIGSTPDTLQCFKDRPTIQTIDLFRWLSRDKQMGKHHTGIGTIKTWLRVWLSRIRRMPKADFSTPCSVEPAGVLSGRDMAFTTTILARELSIRLIVRVPSASQPHSSTLLARRTWTVRPAWLTSQPCHPLACLSATSKLLDHPRRR